ncbi:MAG: four helix bundle protein [Patescibacteria group bacterium]
MIQKPKRYDLEERTALFGEKVIALCRKLKRSVITDPLINQLVRSATSVGANYMEANGASSKRDFTNKIFICKKECQESKHWLRMLASSESAHNRDELRNVWREAQELTLIFQKIASSARKSV